MSYNIRKIIAYMQQYSPKSESRPLFPLCHFVKMPLSEFHDLELPVSNLLRFDFQGVEHLHADMER